MVKIDVTGIQRKLKMAKTGKLIKEVFGNSFGIKYSDLDQIIIRERESSDDFFLIITLQKNEFHLKDRNYFDRTEELAEKYEQLFLGDGAEAIIKTRYFNK